MRASSAAQVAALKAAKCERIYREKASGGRWDRPELDRLMDQLRKGDVLANHAATRVAVRDTGPGLTRESIEHLFDAFYTTKPGSIGMGLSICRSIIEAHGGQIWATANTSGGGAAFQFTLPRQDP
jgi:signal transduction histidine kinase